MCAYNKAPWRYNWDMEKAVKYLKEYFESKQFIGFVLCEENEIAAALFAHSKHGGQMTSFLLMSFSLTQKGKDRGMGNAC